MASIAQPHALTQVSRYLDALENEKKPEKADEAGEDARRELSAVQKYVREERTKHREVLRSWIQQAQGLLIWLVDRQRAGTGSETALFASRATSSSCQWATQLRERCLISAQTWVEHLSFLLDGYIGYTKALMELEAKLEEATGQTAATKKPKISLDGNKHEESGNNDEEDLVPLKVAKSLSLPIARQPH